MPKNGMLTRITLTLAAAAAVSALVVAGAGAASAKRSGGSLVGAGSSLIAPAVQGAWAPLYKSANVEYSSIGSGAGIAQISARTVDFGASDAPMTHDQARHCHGCLQIPWALTATTVVVNVPGVHQGELRLSGPVLAKIYLGDIKSWNDPAIKALNPKLDLPSLHITVAHRSDGSGDSYVFTNYLSKVSSAWSSKVGFATTVSWPAGVGGKGNAGVAAIVRSTGGSIGYVSVAYVLQNHLSMAKLKNAAGKYVLPTIKTIESAAQLIKHVPANNTLSITNPPKSKKFAQAWPLSTFTYIIVPKASPKAGPLKAFIKWALKPTAQKAIQRYVFAPMPKVVVTKARASLNKLHS